MLLQATPGYSRLLQVLQGMLQPRTMLLQRGFVFSPNNVTPSYSRYSRPGRYPPGYSRLLHALQARLSQSTPGTVNPSRIYPLPERLLLPLLPLLLLLLLLLLPSISITPGP